MRIGRSGRLVGFVGAVAAAATLVGAAAAGTGAYFSDTHNGVINGHLGTIQVNTQGSGGTGGDNLAFNWPNILPGEWQTATIHVQNTGNNAEDVWLAFPNANALHALNTLGSYGEMWIGGHHYVNLNDHTASCSDPALCTPVPDQVKVVSNLGVNATATVTVKFRYPGKLTNEHQGEPFNCYNTTLSGTDTPKCDSTRTGTGLPYQVVATQVGISPSQS